MSNPDDNMFMGYDLPTEAQIGKIRSAVENGHFPDVAAVLAGVPKILFNRWMSLSTRQDAPAQLIKLRLNIELGEASLEDRGVSNWISSFGKDWKSVKEFFAVRFPERWNADSKSAERKVDEEEESRAMILKGLSNPGTRSKIEEIHLELSGDK